MIYHVIAQVREYAERSGAIQRCIQYKPFPQEVSLTRRVDETWAEFLGMSVNIKEHPFFSLTPRNLARLYHAGRYVAVHFLCTHLSLDWELPEGSDEGPL